LPTPSIHFDCVVLDVQLRRTSGIELGRLLALARTPVIFVTAHDDPETRASTPNTGRVAHLRKTDSGAEVLAAISSVTT
jgi:DNA-binding response OmpR family regulator